MQRLGAEDSARRTQDPTVKKRLRDNTDQAVNSGVFGVPTFEIDGYVFWGVDATDMVLDYLADPSLLASTEMSRYADLPVGARRQSA